MANEGTIRIHRSIAGTGAAFRVSFVPYDSEEETGGERSFRELQQVRAFVKMLQMKINPETQVIEEAKFKTFGCGSAIASSSLATEWVKGKTVDEALAIKNTDIVRELSLPPVKIHCSVLAEDAIRAAIGDWKKKHGVEVPAAEKAAH